jgi:hypothetical protein
MLLAITFEADLRARPKMGHAQPLCLVAPSSRAVQG